MTSSILGNGGYLLLFSIGFVHGAFSVVCLILGAIVGFVVAKVRYRKWCKTFDAEADDYGEVDEVVTEYSTGSLPDSEESRDVKDQKPQIYSATQRETSGKKKSSVVPLLIVINILLAILLFLTSARIQAIGL